MLFDPYLVSIHSYCDISLLRLCLHSWGGCYCLLKLACLRRVPAFWPSLIDSLNEAFAFTGASTCLYMGSSPFSFVTTFVCCSNMHPYHGVSLQLGSGIHAMQGVNSMFSTSMPA